MIINGDLSLSQQEDGRKNYNRFNFANGLSYICVGETIIILFAIKMGSPDYCIAILGSLLFLSYFCMPLGKLLMARLGACKSVALCWAVRNLSILLLAFAPLAQRYGGPPAATLTIIAAAFAFYACRSIGVIGMQPILGEITTGENRGKFASRSSGLFYLANLVMLVGIIVMMRYSQDTWAFLTIIVTGAAFGLLSSWYLSRINETEAIRHSARQPVIADVRLTLKNPMRLRQLIANCAINAAITLTVPISMLALKKGYGVSDSDALFFALVQLVGAVIAANLIGRLAEETGPRPLTVLFYGLMIALCVLWVIGPDHFKWYYLIWPFALAGAAVTGTGITLTHYFLLSVPPKERVAASLTILVISGVVAGLAGSVIGGGLLKYLGSAGMNPLDSFRAYFLIVLVLLLVGLVVVIRMMPLADWRISDVLALALAPKELLTLFTLYNIKSVADPQQEREDIERLYEIKSGLSEKALLTYLESPKFSVRGRALSALSEIPFGERATEALLAELRDGEYTTAQLAAQIAGEHQIQAAVPLLRQHLNSEDIYLVGKTMLALAQLQDRASYPEIKQIFQSTDNPRLVTNGAAALVEIKDDESFRLLLLKVARNDMPLKVQYELIYSLASLAGLGDDIYKFLKLYRTNKDQAPLYLSELCARLAPASGEEDRKLVVDFASGKIDGVAMKHCLSVIYDRLAAADNSTQTIANLLHQPSPLDMPAELLLCLLALARFRSSGSVKAE